MAEKYRWSLEDDFICCMEYLTFVFDHIGDDDLTTFVSRLAQRLPHIERGSLRMKAQNIKQIALEQGLEDRLTFSPLANYSRQCKRAFSLATEEYEKRGKQNVKHG